MKRKRLQTLKNNLWKLVSEYVRKKGMTAHGYNSCYTCGKMERWQDLHCGHFKHNRLDYDLKNLKPQCAGCNTYRGGKLDIYATRLVKEIGLEAVEDLEIRANQAKKYTHPELENLIEEFKEKLKSL